MPISAQHTKFVYPDYISPLPADDLIKFASKKQEMYDEGVAKVQQNIDAYNSLRSSILTDVEKEYFDKSMGNLVKSISNSAGLDFSNKANVQAVLNIGKPLERDQYITTAISNGKEVSRRQEQLSKMKPGERSVVNDYFYMKDVNDYMNSGKLGQKIGYGKEYTPYVDLSKDWMEFMKTQKPNQNEYFEAQSSMGPAYLEKVTVEGFNTTDLANKFKAFIATDPNKMRQFQMDAGYSLEQVGKEGAYQGYVEDMQAKATTAAENARMFKAETDRLQRAYNTTGSATVKSQLEQARQKATYYEQSRLLAEQKASTTLEDFDLGEYMEIYQDKFATNMGNMYATQKVSKDLISNEYWKEARADARELRKQAFELEKTRKEKVSNVPIAGQVDFSSVKPLINNFDLVRKGLEALGKQASADNLKSEYGNIKGAIDMLKKASGSRGLDQLLYMEAALKNLPPRGLPVKYQEAIKYLLGASPDTDYNDLINIMTTRLSDSRKMLSSQKDNLQDSRTPVNLNGDFTQTKSSLSSFDFIGNSAYIPDNLQIAAPNVTYTTDGVTEKATYKFDIKPGK
jgi:hypothetical protein